MTTISGRRMCSFLLLLMIVVGLRRPVAVLDFNRVVMDELSLISLSEDGKFATMVSVFCVRMLSDDDRRSGNGNGS